jgi:nitrogen fixation-related uncharacterized protein
MIGVLMAIFVVAVLVFIWLKNKQYNRNVDRHNRIADKQEELLEMLRPKIDIEIKQESNKQDNDN